MKPSGVVIAAAVAGLFATGACSKKSKSDTNAGATTEEVGCMGVNSCKGKSACKTAKHSCAGQNSCKGQGWIKASADKCKQLGGRIMADNEGM